MALTDAACRAAKANAKLHKLSGGGGLQLWVKPSGSRLWRYAYRHGGKQKLLALGSYPVVSLADARRARDEAKRLLTQGHDPSEARKRLRVAQAAAANSFRTIAGEYLAKLEREGRAEATLKKVEWLLASANQTIGNMHVQQIAAADVLQALRLLEVRGRHESARRLRSTIGSVFRYAIATARAETDPTSALKGALTQPTVTPVGRQQPSTRSSVSLRACGMRISDAAPAAAHPCSPG